MGPKTTLQVPEVTVGAWQGVICQVIDTEMDRNALQSEFVYLFIGIWKGKGRGGKSRERVRERERESENSYGLILG